MSQLHLPEPNMNAIDKYDRRVEAVNSFVCIGLDSDFDRLPTHFQQDEHPQFAFNRWIIDQTHEFTSAYKPNIAFYEARGDAGLSELKLTLDYLCENHPDILTICDAKRADIGTTNSGYVNAIFDWLGFDAITLHPYLGQEAMKPFLNRVDKGCIILCRTSNPGSSELQNLEFNGKPLWMIIAERVHEHWNTLGNCMLIIGATYPEELRQIRDLVGNMTLLIPGIGAQGGNIEQTVHAGLNAEGKGMIINSSRGIIFSEDPARAVQQFRDAINRYR
ncbi:MAG: orotidine-5'-phosphate decarboxylase [Chitinophagaceae bacterium]|nr:orotidine-5'-phosphate decarboxylase [Anaerolineae bacterium]